MRPIRPSIVVMTSCVIGRAPAKAGAQDHTRRARNSGFLLSQEHERASLSLPRQLAADDHAHHMVGAFEDRMDGQIPPDALELVKTARESCRARLWQYVYISLVAVAINTTVDTSTSEN